MNELHDRFGLSNLFCLIKLDGQRAEESEKWQKEQIIVLFFWGNYGETYWHI